MNKQPSVRDQEKPAGRVLAFIRAIFPAFMAVAFVVLAVGLIALYRGGGQDGSTSQPPSSSSGYVAGALPPPPPFTLPSAGGSAISLADFRGRKNVLLFFNEGTM